MKVTGLDLPDNCSLKFHANGIEVRVSINISRELAKFCPPEKVTRGDKYLVYWVKQDISLPFCSAKNLEMTYNKLLNTAMQNVRMRKREMLESQIVNLQDRYRQINIDFNEVSYSTTG